jgi:hypothetical protein
MPPPSVFYCRSSDEAEPGMGSTVRPDHLRIAAEREEARSIPPGAFIFAEFVGELEECEMARRRLDHARHECDRRNRRFRLWLGGLLFRR